MIGDGNDDRANFLASDSSAIFTAMGVPRS